MSLALWFAGLAATLGAPRPGGRRGSFPPLAPWKAAVELRLQDFADYGAFARRLVDLRRAGQPVIVKVARYAD